MGGAVVDVAGQEHHVAGALALDSGQQPGEFELAAQGSAVLGVGDRLLSFPVGDDDAQRQVGEDHLPRRLRPPQPFEQPLQLLLAEDRGGLLFEPVGVLALVCAHVQHEHVQVRAAFDAAVDALGLEPGATGEAAPVGDRLVLLPGSTAPGGKGVHIAHRVAVVLEQLPGPPVVGGLVVVPGGDHGHLGVHRADVVVHEVVAVAAAELLEGLGHLRHLLGDEVAPQRAVGLLERFGDRTVRVDGVARVEEEVRGEGAHRLVAEHPSDVGVDAVALTRGVRRPHEGLRAVGPVSRGGAELPRADLAASAVLVLEEQLGLEGGAGGQSVRTDPGGEVGLRGGPRPAQRDRAAVAAVASPSPVSAAGEALSVGIEGMEDGVQAPLAGGAGPQHRRARGDVAGLQAGGERQP